MRSPLLAAAIIVLGAVAARSQDAPYDFKQDTPPAPGQVVETPRDELRPAPRLYRDIRPHELGLPTSGPKAADPVGETGERQDGQRPQQKAPSAKPAS